MLPVSKGFCISLSKALNQFRDALRAAEICGVDDIAAQKEEEEEDRGSEVNKSREAAGGKIESAMQE